MRVSDGEETALHFRDLVAKHDVGFLALVAATGGDAAIADAILSGKITPRRAQVDRLTFAIQAVVRFSQLSLDVGQCYGSLGLKDFRVS
jgi:hypothetical protein